MYPKRVDRFRQWSKDMVEGATVDRPRLTGGKNKRTATTFKRRRRRKRKNAKET